MNQGHPYHTIVYLGAGSGRGCDQLAKKCDRLILVEAQPERAKTLNKLAEQWENIEVLCKPVAAEQSSRRFDCYNLPWANGFQLPEVIETYYPNLQRLSSRQVQTTDLGSLLNECGTVLDSNLLIIIDLPGMEFELVSNICTLAEAPLPDLLITTTKLQEAESDSNQHPMTKLLSDFSYSHSNATDIVITVQPWQQLMFGRQDGLALCKKQHKIEVAALQLQIDTLNEQLQIAEATNADLSQQVEQQVVSLERYEQEQSKLHAITEEQQQQIVSVTEQLHTSDRANKEILEQLEKERTAKEAIHLAHIEHKERADELSQRWNAIQAKMAEQAKQFDAQKAIIARYEQQQLKLKSLSEEQQQQIARVTEQLQTSESANNQISEQLTQERTDRETAEKLKIESDKKIDELVRRVQASEPARDKLIRQRDEQNAKLEKSNQAFESLKQSYDKLQKQLAQAEDDKLQLQQQCDRLATDLEHQSQTLANNNQNMTIALRLQAIRDSDLKDLQHRYAELRASKEAQEMLLRKLTERLAQAATLLRTNDTATSSEALVGELIEGFRGSAD